MKKLGNSIWAVIALFVFACAPLSTNTPLDSKTPVAIITPTAGMSSTAEVIPSPVPTTATPVVAVTEDPAQTPEPTVRVEEKDIFCPSENEAARNAYDQANDLSDAGNFADAEQLYLSAIELDPTFCDAMDNLGRLLRQQDRVDEAITWYLKSLEILPTNTVALQNLALAYKMQGNVDQSTETYEKLIEVAPENPEGYFGLGTIYYDLQQYEMAIGYFETAETLYIQENSPYVLDAQYYLGFANFYMQNCVEAKRYLESIYEQFSEDGGINYAIGVCYLVAEPVDVSMAREYILKAQELGIQIPVDVLEAIKE